MVTSTYVRGPNASIQSFPEYSLDRSTSFCAADGHLGI